MIFTILTANFLKITCYLSLFYISLCDLGLLAQWIEHQPPELGVAGSIPA